MRDSQLSLFDPPDHQDILARGGLRFAWAVTQRGHLLTPNGYALTVGALAYTFEVFESQTDTRLAVPQLAARREQQRAARRAAGPPPCYPSQRPVWRRQEVV